MRKKGREEGGGKGGRRERENEGREEEGNTVLIYNLGCQSAFTTRRCSTNFA